MNDHTITLAIAAKTASLEMAKASLEQKNRALKALIEHLKEDRVTILRANRHDLLLAEEQGLSTPLLERLSLEKRLDGMIHDIEQVISLPDPIGELFDEQCLPNELNLAKRRTPIGVFGVIYESRPNVTIDIGMLVIKSGNCAILRGGSEALHTNQILVELIQKSLVSAGLPEQAIQGISNQDRAEVQKLLQLHDYIDLIIPRGNSTLQQFCKQHSTIPVVTGGIGICHLFVDESADLERSLKVILNAKTQRPTVCNALDTLLIHAAIAPLFMPQVVKILEREGVTFRLDPKSWEWLKTASCTPAKAEDWHTEWLSLVLGIRVVESLDEAIEHVQTHSTGHSDGILTESVQNAERFLREIDSAAVYVNASTRFTDGGQFGLGAEVAISTQKFHARGPMGLKELTSYKWVIRGNYQIRT